MYIEMPDLFCVRNIWSFKTTGIKTGFTVHEKLQVLYLVIHLVKQFITDSHSEMKIVRTHLCERDEW